MFFIYNSLLVLAAVALSPLLAVILLTQHKHRQGFFEKCALVYQDSLPCSTGRPFWIHAVSVGEVMAAVPLIRELKRCFPERPVVLSTTTATGNATARANAQAADAIIYFPFDIPCFVHRAVARIQPDMFLTLETEIWPNLFRILHARDIPVLIVSGRISQKSFQSYTRFRFFFQRVLRSVTHFCMQSSPDAERIISIGAQAQRVSICGNIKFDQHVPVLTDDEKAELSYRFAIKPGQPVLIAGSTHRGEEQQVLDAFLSLLRQVPDLILLLAPRHPERFNEVADTLIARKIQFVRRTTLNNGTSRVDEPVILLDTIGELARIYSIGTIIFIGGSLVDGIGGHNPLEPAASSKPVIFGPHMSNFAEIATILTAKQAAFKIQDKQALVEKTLELLNAPELCATIGATAFDVIRRNSGAVKKITDTVQSVLHQRTQS